MEKGYHKRQELTMVHLGLSLEELRYQPLGGCLPGKELTWWIEDLNLLSSSFQMVTPGFCELLVMYGYNDAPCPLVDEPLCVRNAVTVLITSFKALFEDGYLCYDTEQAPIRSAVQDTTRLDWRGNNDENQEGGNHRRWLGHKVSARYQVPAQGNAATGE